MDDQLEIYENARKRVLRKKRLYTHLILFLVGSVFLYLINKLFHVGEPYNWYQWAIVLWFFFFVIHIINVYVTHPFMGKDWELKQTAKLVHKQEQKIAQLEDKLAKKKPPKNESSERPEQD